MKGSSVLAGSSLGLDPAASVGRWVGVEHEFEVIDGAGVKSDFREILPGLERLGIGGLDPGDCHARRCGWGGVVTADGREAEIATPPVSCGPGSAERLEELSRTGRAELEEVLVDSTLRGYSTHVSVEVDDRVVVRAAKRFVAVYSAPMMLLVDNVASPGILVRPRRGRLEVCGDFVSGEQLVAATVFATAGALDCAKHTRVQWHRQRGSLRCRPEVERALERYGWYIDRAAFGTDLYTHGRATRLRSGRTAQQQLEMCWSVLRPSATEWCSEAEVGAVDRVVEGIAVLPCEVAA